MIVAPGIPAPAASRTIPAIAAVVAESCADTECEVEISSSPASARRITFEADRKLIHQLDLLRIGEFNLGFAVIIDEFSRHHDLFTFEVPHDRKLWKVRIFQNCG